MDGRTVLLEYYLSDNRAVVFVATAERLAVVPLATNLADVRRLADRWQLNLDATARAIGVEGPLTALGRNARGLLEALYRALLAPVEAILARYSRLVVVPYGPLHGIPFHALHDGTQYLVERLEVSASPSTRLYALCLRRPRRTGRRGLVVAYSDGGRLSGAVAEAESIAGVLRTRTYLEDEATRAAFIAAAPDFPVVHLAAHGESRPDNPDFAHLRLADGQLSAIDVFNLDLRGALVTLSGCETGRAVVAGGDELIGLSRGFLHAGAIALVQSLWRVEDGSTARLMTHFYRALSAGQSAGEALRGAQLTLLAERPVHPYYWAPFQLIGNAGTKPQP
jgi:CHAT domain-containing protein